MNNPPPFKGLHTRILFFIPIKGSGFSNHGFTLIRVRPAQHDAAEIEVHMLQHGALEDGYFRDYIGDCYRGYKGHSRSLDFLNRSLQ